MLQQVNMKVSVFYFLWVEVWAIKKSYQSQSERNIHIEENCSQKI